MIKPSKVVFISDELERDFNVLRKDDAIKKGIIRAIKDLQQMPFLGCKYQRGYSPKSMCKNMASITFGNMTCQMDGDCYTQ